MLEEKNISGVSENLADSILEQKTVEIKQSEKGNLYGKQIAISVSDSEELEQLGLSEHHIKDISIEIARYLIVSGSKMLYGGDLRNGGYTELFTELSHQYKYLNDKERKFINYFPFPNSNTISTDELAKLQNKQVEPIILEVPKHLGKIDKYKKYEPFKNIEDRYIFGECFTDMRIKMTNDCNARIVLGGKQKNFIGYLPGIVEETFHSLNAGKAVYLLGGFGGATKSIIDIILGGKPQQLTNQYQYDTDFLFTFKEFVSSKSTINIDYDFLYDFLSNYSLETISKQNGLEIWENQILFESTNIHELVFLIMKGLKNI